MTEAQIKYMVNRFLGWRLPENFNPDGGISFKKTFNEHTAYPIKNEPVGTNLLDAIQAEVMVRYMVEGMPVSTSAEARAPETAAQWMQRTGEHKTELLASVGMEIYREIIADMDEFAAERVEALSTENERLRAAIEGYESPDYLLCDNQHGHPTRCHCLDPLYYKGRAEKAESDLAEARAALNRLRNEVLGLLGIAKDELRTLVGNTNLQALQVRLDEAHAALRGVSRKEAHE